jgi:hypothetical protein
MSCSAGVSVCPRIVNSFPVVIHPPFRSGSDYPDGPQGLRAPPRSVDFLRSLGLPRGLLLRAFSHRPDE